MKPAKQWRKVLNRCFKIGVTAIRWCVRNGHDDTIGSREDLIHYTDLVASLIDVLLVNAYCVDPEASLSMLVPQLAKCMLAVDSDVH